MLSALPETRCQLCKKNAVSFAKKSLSKTRFQKRSIPCGSKVYDRQNAVSFVRKSLSALRKNRCQLCEKIAVKKVVSFFD